MDAATETPVEEAYVSVEDSVEYFDSAYTDASGNVAFSDVPATEISIYAEGYNGSGYAEKTATVVVAPDTTTEITVELEFPAPDEPGISVSVSDATFGGGVAGASVTLKDGVTNVDTVTTDEDGSAFFAAAPGENYTVEATAAGFLPQESPAEVSFDGDYGYADIALEADLRCNPSAVNPALTNMGFEDGLNGWTVGREHESIQAVGSDAFTSPWEGSAMLRLGDSQPDADQPQAPGPNILCQDFVATQDVEKFSFNIFTYDYTGFDEFQFDLVVSDGESGDTLATYETGAFGEGTELKTTGWRGVSIDTSDYLGSDLRLTLRAGGTSDDLYAFWAYVDSADVLPPQVNINTSIDAGNGSVTIDPTTGQYTIAMPAGNLSDLDFRFPASCESGEAPTAVSLLFDSVAYDAAPVPDQAGKYTATIPADALMNGTVTLQVQCEGSTVVSTPIGNVVLYDPSGIITDSATGEPVVGAEVFLHKVPDWLPRTDPSDTGPNTCETNESKAPGAPWSQPAPTDLGVLVNAASPEISPHVNPFLTSIIGYYGWDVAMGCWYVTVSAEGYDDLVSPVVGVPSEVTDLDLQLTPEEEPDTTPPDTVITSGPAEGATITTNSATFEFTGDPLADTASFECRLDTGTFTACTSPKALTGLGDGPHTFSVRATDAASNTDTTPATRTFTVDTTPPDTVITSGPAEGATITTNSATFEFTGDPLADTASFECRLDTGTFTACTSPKALTGLGNGPHTFSVRATDAASNTDTTPATRTFTVNVTPQPTAACTQAKADLAKAEGQVKAFTAKVTAAKKKQAKAKASLKKAKQFEGSKAKKAKKVQKAEAKLRKAKASLKKAVLGLKSAQQASADAQSRVQQNC